MATKFFKSRISKDDWDRYVSYVHNAYEMIEASGVKWSGAKKLAEALKLVEKMMKRPLSQVEIMEAEGMFAAKAHRDKKASLTLDNVLQARITSGMVQ